MTEPEYLTNHFLIAMPGLTDPNFAHTLTYVCEHNAEGAMGIVVNRPMDISLGEVLKQLELEWPGDEVAGRVVFSGGPVEEQRGFVLHVPVGDWDATFTAGDVVGVTSSKDILEAIGRNVGPERFLVALGYAGWGPGQLEQEISHNAWLSGPADLDILFDTPAEQRLEAAAGLLGVDMNRLSSDVGHA